MKILLDHKTPHGLRHLLTGHEVETAQCRGWDTRHNGDLLMNALDHGFQPGHHLRPGLPVRTEPPCDTDPVPTITTSSRGLIRSSASLIEAAISSVSGGSRTSGPRWSGS